MDFAQSGTLVDISSLNKEEKTVSNHGETKTDDHVTYVQDTLHKAMTMWSYQVKTISIKNGDLIVSKNDKEAKDTLGIAKGISMDVNDIRVDAVYIVLILTRTKFNLKCQIST